jgi:enoyl-CoA hydratase/carnithine racemase
MAFTSEPIPARTMQQYGVVNRVFSDDALAAESLSFAQKIAGGPTLAHAAPKALLRAWALRGVGAADEAPGCPLSRPPAASADQAVVDQPSTRFRHTSRLGFLRRSR